jgi:SAM-dependent methyltransferase
MLLRTWLAAARGRRYVQRAVRPLEPFEPLIRRYAPGRSFLDVGAMWGVHGRTAFLAEEAGATAVTAIDISGPTPEFLTERERRGSAVRFETADLHDPATTELVGAHDVVWCAGVLYHCPDPVHSIGCLRRLTTERLVLLTASVPELPGVEGASVFFPHLPEAARHAYDEAYRRVDGSGAARIGLTTPFDPEQGYGNWWWGLSPSAITGMLRAGGFTVEDVATNGFHTRVVAR